MWRVHKLEKIKTNGLKVDHLVWKFFVGLIDEPVKAFIIQPSPLDITDYTSSELALDSEPILIKERLLTEEIVHFALGHALALNLVREPLNKLFVSHANPLRGRDKFAAQTAVSHLEEKELA